MIPLTLAEIAVTVDGRLAHVSDPSRTVTGTVEFDSRAIGPGGLFVALVGQRVDGHDFAQVAMSAGAIGVLAARPLAGVPTVVVSDVQAALGHLARAVVDRLPGLTIVGVTGSSGKTSTKDLLAHVLAAAGPTVAPPGSFNNEIGHPHTALRATRDTGYLVLECSARGPGHIEALCRIAPPHIGVVLNVGTAHLGEFGSRAAIAVSKAELVEALPADGVAVLNADDPVVLAMTAKTEARVVTVGRSAEAAVRAEDVELDAAGRASYTLVGPAGRSAVSLGLYGAHHVGNSLAAAAVALELGMSMAAVSAALATARPASRWRMEVADTDDGVRVVNDAYNANPESMAAALQALAAMSAGRRTWAVLGEMAELGEHGRAAHAEAGRLVGELGIDRLVTVGPAAAAILDGASGVAVPDAAAAVDLLRRDTRPGDVVLVKASRSAGLERVAAALLAARPSVGTPA
ncbi:MAG: UDP-N-acetylmuramoyl-tripeptide--D-alanyl-D-alanine ligase [Geodermatophilaceae bacterium]|nr:UDP-N-acetylmuramoyl-tripeptide--D-alanyl-D-alanine ligase [Geodermatophilaceae bacterium]